MNTVIKKMGNKLHIIRRFRYARAYFWMFVRYLRLHYPSDWIYRVVFLTLIRNQLKIAIKPSPTSLVENKSDANRYKSLRDFQSKKVALALPLTARRFDFLMEGEMLFAYNNSLLGVGVEALKFDSEEEPTNLTHRRAEVLSELLNNQIEILILQGDSKLNNSRVFNKELIHDIRKRNIAVVIDLVDCFVTRDGQRTLDFFYDKVDFIVYHNSRLKIEKSFLNKSLIWPSLPYPESFYLRHHSEERFGLLVPGSSHRDRKFYVDRAKKKDLSFSDSLFSKSDSSAATYSYETYVKRLCQSRLVFTNGYKNHRESQVIGRVTEVMLAKSTLLYESGSDINFFFSEYQDYVPVFNIPDFTYKANYLLGHPSEAEQIASNALSTMLDKFSTIKFWTKVFSSVS